ncbi:MAG: DUF4401 domain-containing protein [Flavobacteriales bacterium]
MRNKENIKELLDYFQAIEGKELQFDEDAIVTAYQKDNDHQTLAIKVLSVFGGILASLAFLGFLFISGLYDSDWGLLIFGVLCMAGAIWANKKYDKIIIDTVSVSFFIVGFILLGLGLNQLQISDNTISAVFMLIALLSLSIVQNYILSFISVLIVNGSILFILIDSYNLIHIYVSVLTLMVMYLFLKEAKIVTTSKALSKLYNPMRIGIVFSFISGLIILGEKGILPVLPDYVWLPSIVLILAIIYLLPYLFKVMNITKTLHKAGIYIFSVLLLLPTVLYPAISGAILIVLLSFLVDYKTGLIIGIMALIYFISQYYYDLSFTLLTKSILLFSSGVLFIGLYLFMYKKTDIK